MAGGELYVPIWYRLYDAGNSLPAVARIKFTKNEIEGGVVVEDFCDQVYSRKKNTLANYGAGDLIVYPKGTTIDDYQQNLPLGPALKLNDYQIQGTSEDDPLLVVLSSPILPSSAAIMQQQPFVLSETQHRGFQLMLEEFYEREKTIVLSLASVGNAESLVNRMELVVRGASWSSNRLPPDVPSVAGFPWMEGAEDSNANRDAYMVYLRKTLLIPTTHQVEDTQSNRGLLSVELNTLMDDVIKMRGTTDVAIAKSEHVVNDALRYNIEVLLELKKPQEMESKDHVPQTICKHFAASYLNRKHPVVSVLTDLNAKWTFFWFADDMDNNSGMALYKLCLEGGEAARDAKYLLDSIFDKSVVDNLPKSFHERKSYEDVLGCLTGARKRPRESGLEPSASNGDNSQSLAHSNRGDGAPSSKKMSRKQANPGDECRDGNTNGMTMAESLSLFAPPSSRDVANELDLLDMVDADEQYEIIRSFAARHIVPFIKEI